MDDLPQNMDFDNLEFQYAWDLVNETRESVFLTGKAGTGKSTFLRYISKNTKKRHIKLAPTGIASIHIQGETLHSFFQLPLGPLIPGDARLLEQKFRKKKKKIIQKLELIIIDEVSMVRADLLDALDRILRRVTGFKNKPFGGKQLLLVGDLFQLEPVVTGEEEEILNNFYDTSYFFGARVLKEIELVNIELQKVYRQKDENFIGLLNKIRSDQASWQVLNTLNRCYDPRFRPPEKGFYVTLSTTRRIADNTNHKQVETLKSKKHIFHGEIDGEFWVKSLPTDKKLILKEGAQVMFVRNDSTGERRWVNGTLGIVKSIEEDVIQVQVKNGEVHEVEQNVWDNYRYEFDEQENKIYPLVIGTFKQLPLKLAWAVTIHKSQGLTFNDVIIDLGWGAFAAGQLYVALSRCTTFNGIVLKKQLRFRDIIVKPEVIEYYKKMNDQRQIQTLLDNT